MCGPELDNIFVRDWGDTCNICQKRYPTEDHLVQHLGNFHCKIDHYLIKKGLRIITKVGIVRDKRSALIRKLCFSGKYSQIKISSMRDLQGPADEQRRP